MTQIQVMYANGVLGNHGLLNATGALTCGVFNYLRAENTPPKRLQDILGASYDYIWPPMSDADKQQSVSSSILAFMRAAPGFNTSKLGAANG